MSNGPTDSIGGVSPGTLFVVATPIGNLADLGARARDVLGSADLLLAEDTRHTLQLLRASAIGRAPGTLESLHEHNERERTARVVGRLLAGESVALVSDAGTPLVSDPGAFLVRAAAEAGITVSPVPGPCAAIAALSVSALPADRFAFEGFLPAKSSARRGVLEGLARETRTLVFYEAPHRIEATLGDLAEILGETRRAAVSREISKKFETTYRGTLGELRHRVAADADMRRGEIVIVVEGGGHVAGADEAELDRVLRLLLAELPAAQAARLAARLTGADRRELYARATRLRDPPV